MDNIQVQNQLMEGSPFSISQIFWLAAVGDPTDRLPTEFKDAVQDDNLAEVIGVRQSIEDLYYEPFDANDFLTGMQELGKLGFVGKIEMPVPQQIHKSGYSYSWGYLHYTYLYAETLKELLEAVVTYRDKYLEEQRKKLKK